MGIGSPLAHPHVVCSAFAIPGLPLLSKEKLDSKIWYFLVIQGYWELTADRIHSTLLAVSGWYQGSQTDESSSQCPSDIPVGFPL